MMQKLNIIISGYGKMGKVVDKAVSLRGHLLLAHIDNRSEWDKLPAQFPGNTVVIDFSMPDVVVENINRCFVLGLPVVVGTTGWYGRLEEISKQCKEKNGSLLYAPNFSIGVHILFYLNRELARIMSGMEDYSAEIKEIHHVDKLDAPSGTAIQLANDILSVNRKYKKWGNEKNNRIDELRIVSERKDEVTGTHIINYDSSVDSLTLKHEAKSREGFVRGALLAAEFLYNKKGIFTMNNLLQTLTG